MQAGTEAQDLRRVAGQLGKKLPELPWEANGTDFA